MSVPTAPSNLSFAKIPPGLNPFAISAFPNQKIRTRLKGDHSVTMLHGLKILPHAVFADHTTSSEKQSSKIVSQGAPLSLHLVTSVHGLVVFRSGATAGTKL